MNQARSEEEEKEMKRDRKDRGQEADGKKGSPAKQKPICGAKKNLPRLLVTAQVNKAGEGRLNFF